MSPCSFDFKGNTDLPLQVIRVTFFQKGNIMCIQDQLLNICCKGQSYFVLSLMITADCS